MRTILLLLLAFGLRAQLPAFIQDDKFKHDQAGMLIGGLASSSYYFFIPNKAMAFLVGNGVPSFWDGFSTYFGAKRITLMFIIGANENEKKLARKDYFEK